MTCNRRKQVITVQMSIAHHIHDASANITESIRFIDQKLSEELNSMKQIQIKVKILSLPFEIEFMNTHR